MNNIAVIALDMDGTLLTSNHDISTDTIDSLQLARKKGVEVILVTGRHHMLACPTHAFLNLDTPIICSNGAYIFDPFQKQIVSGFPLTEMQWRNAISLVNEFSLDVICHLETGLGHSPDHRIINIVKQYTDTFLPHLRPTYFPETDLVSLCEKHAPVWKMEMEHPDASIIDLVAEKLTSEFGMTCDRTSPTGIEVVNQASSKGNGLALWTQKRGYRMEQVIAFGDNRNDISMFQQVGLGVAMGNALPDVQSYAHYVTETNDQNGISLALERWVL